MWILDRLLTWWNGQTLNTQIWTWLYGKKVGEDALGNRYFEDKNRARRWVIYNGESQASRVPPEWHGWLHHTFDLPPTEEPLPTKIWQKEPVENLTGTADAYRPAGSILRTGSKERVDYEAWQPE